MNIAIYGYGNLGRGVEAAILRTPDAKLFGVFTRRPKEAVVPVTKNLPVYPANDVLKYKEEIDFLVICGGSATDLPEMTPYLAEHFNVIDSFDTHAKIPEHFKKVDAAARAGGHIALISGGWDPGMFSINRLYSTTILPDGKDYTFWGRGVSQGHSNAVRRVPGVLDARQYTVPIPEALEAVKRGEQPKLTTAEKHKRECFVVAAPNADLAEIERKIKTMPEYFADYQTTVTFISAEEMEKNHFELPHGGSVIRSGGVGFDLHHQCTIEYRLQLDSNPEFTAGVLIAFARALNKMYLRGVRGCQTVFDVAPADLSPLTPEELRAQFL